MPPLSEVKPNAVINGCCLEVMEAIAVGSVDLVLSDPPYATTQLTWDKLLDPKRYWQQINRILKPGGLVVLTAAQPFATSLITTNSEYGGNNFKYDLIWHKNKATGHLNAKVMPMRNHEHILVFGGSAGTYNPQMTSGHDPLHYAVNRGKTEVYGKFDSVESRTGATDRYPKSVLEFSVVNNSDRIHPTEKPLDMFQYLVKTYSNEGDVVVDPCAGSLTTGIACKTTNRRYICIEKDLNFIEAAIHRLEGDLFD